MGESQRFGLAYFLAINPCSEAQVARNRDCQHACRNTPEGLRFSLPLILGFGSVAWRLGSGSHQPSKGSSAQTPIGNFRTYIASAVKSNEMLVPQKENAGTVTPSFWCLRDNTAVKLQWSILGLYVTLGFDPCMSKMRT